MSPPGAHPRVCGENAKPGEDMQAAFGSSPRVRGKQGLRGCVTRGLRLIPACAGKTTTNSAYAEYSAAHPRVCGENSVASVLSGSRSGSSPRVRGKRREEFADVVRARLIPACAGKTPRASPAKLNSPAHPRVCGENEALVRLEAVMSGSSPRVRGKHSG